MMEQCPQCGTVMSKAGESCPVCENTAKPILKIATTSQVLAILGVLTTFMCTSIVFDAAALFSGIIAMYKIKKSDGLYWGKNRAITGIVLGSLMLVVTVLVSYSFRL